MDKGSSSGSLKTFYVILGIVAVIGLGAVARSVGSKSAAKAATEPVKISGVDDPVKLTEMAKGVTMGNPDAPVTLMVFEDYLCPHCAHFTTEIEPQIKAQLVDPGKVKLVYHDFPLQPASGSFLAARAARCANDQGKFWEYQDILFRNQGTWGLTSEKEPVLMNYADGLDLDMGEFRKCLDSDKYADVVTANLELAKALGLEGTPSLLVGAKGGMGRLLSDYQLPSVKKAVDAVLRAEGK
jgi:protein-disulfide isomerase